MAQMTEDERKMLAAIHNALMVPAVGETTPLIVKLKRAADFVAEHEQALESIVFQRRAISAGARFLIIVAGGVSAIGAAYASIRGGWK